MPGIRDAAGYHTDAALQADLTGNSQLELIIIRSNCSSRVAVTSICDIWKFIQVLTGIYMLIAQHCQSHAAGRSQWRRPVVSSSSHSTSGPRRCVTLTNMCIWLVRDNARQPLHARPKEETADYLRKGNLWVRFLLCARAS
jgi:hypothetical protein